MNSSTTHNRKRSYRPATLFLFSLFPLFAFGQATTVTDSSRPGQRTVIAGQDYEAGPMRRRFFGHHYHKEWTTPVTVPVLRLDTVDGGLEPVATLDNPQTLLLKGRSGKDYVLRTVHRDYSAALPPITRGTFIENLARRQQASAHPFAALTVPVMAGAAGIAHTNPRLVIISPSPALGTQNALFGNRLCLLDERSLPGEGARLPAAPATTDSLLKLYLEQPALRTHQDVFVRARLFDMFLGDWNRSESKWSWVRRRSGPVMVYQPLPFDRDQIYSRFDGFFPYMFTSPEELEHLTSFQPTIRNVKKFNFPARYLDRLLTNEVSGHTWKSEAEKMQGALTDRVIETSIRQMPPEVFPYSGPTLIDHLKSRRAQLPRYAAKQYKYLAEEVDVLGSPGRELFRVERLNDEQTKVTVTRLNEQGQPEGAPFYNRTFWRYETDEIRLYGLSGNDRYLVEGPARKAILLRIVGGTDRDSLVSTSSAPRRRLHYYDNPGNSITGPARRRLSADTAINAYNYRGYRENVGHTIKLPYYSNLRGIHLNFGYTYTKQRFRKVPFAWQQSLKAVYSITNNAFGADYSGIYNLVSGKWNLLLNGRYDQALRNLYFGTGNETKNTEEAPFYRLFTSELMGSIGLQRMFSRYHRLQLLGFYQSVKVLDGKEEASIAKLLRPMDPSVFNRKHFGGGELSYLYRQVNQELVPTRGVDFLATASYTQNLQETDRSFYRYLGNLQFYLPLSPSFSLSVRSGGSTIIGDPEFYQLNWLGGGQNLKGYRRQRFSGKTVFFNNNELRFIRPVHNFLFNGQAGLVGFFDEGRVWQPGEVSDKWHYGYGGGLLLSFFNKLAGTVYYGLSEEGGRLHFRLSARL
ncbi:BamA/TamA family outer membrane protein [Paraflavisolibacter sp. H34]|uniref:BamA/TamA family outer membrane protein n=1 Tax=Huijunlia imazamoxiresistens TaxID=3127457 RepID=UPI0030191275